MQHDAAIACVKAGESALRGFGVAALHRFGSHARVDAGSESDIDVLE